MAHAAVDIWKINPNDQVDMRMNRQLLDVVQVYVPGCHMLISSVEAHIQEADHELEMLSAEQKQEIWGQALLHELEYETVSWLGYTSLNFLS